MGGEGEKPTYPPAHLVVVQVHKVADVAAVLVADGLGGVDEVFGEPQSVLHVVAAAAPLPAFHVSLAVARHVARAVSQVSGRARLRHRMNYSGTEDGVDEGCLLRACTQDGATSSPQYALMSVIIN